MGDANRLYTSVSTEQVLSAAKSSRDEYEALNDDDRVSVLHTRRVKGYVGGSTHNNKTGTTFTLDELMNITRFATMCRVFTVGSALVRQMLGVPMGGHMSKIFISLLLCTMESDVFEDRKWLVANDFFSEMLANAGIHPSEVFNGVRHVGDVLIFS